MRSVADFPVIGESIPWMPSFGSFRAFDTGAIHGLAMVAGDRIDFLAVGAWIQGQGDFSRFLAECKEHYATIGIWEILNPDLPETLARRGFVPETAVIDRDVTSGMIWRKAR